MAEYIPLVSVHECKQLEIGQIGHSPCHPPLIKLIHGSNTVLSKACLLLLIFERSFVGAGVVECRYRSCGNGFALPEKSKTPFRHTYISSQGISSHDSSSQGHFVTQTFCHTDISSQIFCH